MNDESQIPDPELRPEYDFSDGERGKYAERFAKGTNLIAISPELAKEFPDSQSVNDALRAFLRMRREGTESA